MIENGGAAEEEGDEEGALSMSQRIALRYHLGLDAINEEAALALRDAFEQRHPSEAGPLVCDPRFQAWWEQEKSDRAPEITEVLLQLKEHLSPASSEALKEPSSLDWSSGALSAVLGALFRPEPSLEDSYEAHGGLSQEEYERRRALAREGIIIDF